MYYLILRGIFYKKSPLKTYEISHTVQPDAASILAAYASSHGSCASMEANARVYVNKYKKPVKTFKAINKMDVGISYLHFIAG